MAAVERPNHGLFPGHGTHNLKLHEDQKRSLTRIEEKCIHSGPLLDLITPPSLFPLARHTPCRRKLSTSQLQRTNTFHNQN